MSRLYVEIVWSRSSPAYYDFLAVSSPLPLPLSLLRITTPLASPVFPLCYFVFPLLASPTLSPSALNKSARYLIVTGLRWKVRAEVSVLLFTPEGTSKLRDSIK